MTKASNLTNQIESPHLRPHTADLNRLLAGEHHDPHSVLGAHEYGDHTVIRVFRPHAVELNALIGGVRYPLQHIEAGLFAVAVPFTNLVDYRLEVDYTGGESGFVHTFADAYRFLPTLGEVDLHLFAEGRHERLWEILGAHPRSFTTADGVVDGVSFAVWAPNAKGVSVVGDFNHWGDEAQMRVARVDRRLGAVLAQLPRGRALQVPGARRRRRSGRPRRSDGVRHRGAATDGVPRASRATTPGPTTPGCRGGRCATRYSSR